MSGVEHGRDDHSYWSKVCICGLGEQERTGHYPEHADWCEVPSPLDEDCYCGAEGGEGCRCCTEDCPEDCMADHRSER